VVSAVPMAGIAIPAAGASLISRHGKSASGPNSGAHQLVGNSSGIVSGGGSAIGTVADAFAVGDGGKPMMIGTVADAFDVGDGGRARMIGPVAVATVADAFNVGDGGRAMMNGNVAVATVVDAFNVGDGGRAMTMIGNVAVATVADAFDVGEKPMMIGGTVAVADGAARLDAHRTWTGAVAKGMTLALFGTVAVVARSGSVGASDMVVSGKVASHSPLVEGSRMACRMGSCW
jgi:hypothetical protein